MLVKAKTAEHEVSDPVTSACVHKLTWNPRFHRNCAKKRRSAETLSLDWIDKNRAKVIASDL
jgi:hypothetical protein